MKPYNQFTSTPQLYQMNELQEIQEEPPCRLIELRRLRLEHEEKVRLMRSRLTHLMKKKQDGEKRIKSSHDEIDKLIKIKT